MLRRTSDTTLPPRKRCRGNLRPAPFFLTPETVRGVIELSQRPARAVEVPVAPVCLVDRPRRSEDPRLARANDDFPAPADPDLADPVREDWADAPLPEEFEPAREDVNDTTDDAGAADPAPREELDAPLGRMERRRDAMYRSRIDADERALESPVDVQLHRGERPRIEIIRAAAKKLREAAVARDPLPPIGQRNPRPKAPLPPLAADQRRARIEAAMAFLKSRGVLVSVADRLAMIRTYRVAGRREAMLAEDVIAMAVAMGMAEGRAL